MFISKLYKKRQLKTSKDAKRHKKTNLVKYLTVTQLVIIILHNVK